jgi:hypothetical protein
MQIGLIAYLHFLWRCQNDKDSDQTRIKSKFAGS